MKRTLIQQKLVWTWMENDTATHSALHCYYGRKRKDHIGLYTGETHDGNSALCNKNFGVSEDGSSFLPIDKIEPYKLVESMACKKCLKSYIKIIGNGYMTPSDYLSWLDEQIAEAERMASRESGKWEGDLSYSGRASALEQAKEKFLTIEYPQPTENERDFTTGLE